MMNVLLSGRVCGAALVGLFFLVTGVNGQFAQPPQPPMDSSQHIAARIVESKVPVLIDFWAAWCMPCRMISPAIAELEKEYRGKIIVVKIDIDVHRQISEYFGVTSIPLVCVVKDRAVVKAVPGAHPKETYKALVEEVLAMKLAPDSSKSAPPPKTATENKPAPKPAVSRSDSSKAPAAAKPN